MEEQAVAWFVRMRAPHSAEEAARFDQWFEASAEHRHAYAWAKLHFDNAESLKLSRRYGRRRSIGPSIRLIGAAVAAAIIAVIVLGLSLWPVERMMPAGDQARSSPILQTLPGQIDAVELNDGIVVTMDTNSRVAVAVDGLERRLRLERGRARIAVQPDSRPFVMEAGGGELFTRAAMFDIDRTDEGAIEIAVLSGDLEVRKLLRPAVLQAPLQRFKAGQSLAYGAEDFRPIAPSRFRINRRNWPEGWAEYGEVPLKVLIADANRYARRPIMLDDPVSGTLLVSGRFQLTRTDRFAARVADLFDLTVVDRADSLHLRQP
jgi:transmembrane sensor